MIPSYDDSTTRFGEFSPEIQREAASNQTTLAINLAFTNAMANPVLTQQISTLVASTPIHITIFRHFDPTSTSVFSVTTLPELEVRSPAVSSTASIGALNLLTMLRVAQYITNEYFAQLYAPTTSGITKTLMNHHAGNLTIRLEASPTESSYVTFDLATPDSSVKLSK